MYLRNRRAAMSASQRLLGWTLVPLSVAIVWLLLMGQGGWWHGAIYTAFVAAMAAAAWTSRFPRYRTGVGAVLFLVSDLLIFARLRGAVPDGVAAMLICSAEELIVRERASSARWRSSRVSFFTRS